jgi:rod shape-determining protein MreD
MLGILWGIGVLFCVAQVTVIQSIGICQVIPNIVLAFIIYIALFRGGAGIWVGFVMGLFIDLYSPAFGYNALMGTIIGYGIRLLSLRIYKELPLLWSIILFSCSLLYGGVVFAASYGLSFYFFFRYIIGEALYTAVIGTIIFYCLRKIKA